MNVGLIFDMDGLLVDSEKLWTKVEEELLASRGATFSAEVAKKHMGMRVSEAARVMVESYGLPDDPARFGEELIDAVLAEFREALEPMPGAEVLIAQAIAHEVPVAIASSSPMRVVEFVTERFGWHAGLHAICAGDEATVKQGKPAPDIFLLAAERMAVAPERCVVLEDSQNGARAAKAAGMFCIAVPNPIYEKSDFEGIADCVLSSLEELTIEELFALPKTI